MRRKYLLFLLIPLALTLTGCFGKSDWRDTKTANITLSITPNVFYVDRRTNVKTVLRETNGIGVNLNYWVWQTVKTGTEAEEQFDKIFGMHYLFPWGTLEGTVSVLYGLGLVGEHTVIMGGEDSNGNSVRASAEYSVRR